MVGGLPIRASFVALALATLVVVAATAFFTGAKDPADPARASEGPAASRYDATVTSFDGVGIALTVYRPANATADAPVPVILHSHGWSGSRTDDGAGLAGRLWDAGYGVVSIDARGHGDSGGYAQVHHKDAEVKDMIAVLDWIHDDLEWVQKETASGIPKDIVAGGAGYSYGGAFQLMTASYDARLDALAPEITWADLPYALAPAGVAKSVWIDFLYGTAWESGTRIDPRIHEWYAQIMLTNKVPADALEHFRGSSPVHENITADVLLVQGVPDVLFNLNQALLNHERLEAAGAGDIRLFTHLTGHVVPYAQPFGSSFERRDIFLDEGPCGSNTATILAWMDEKLRGGEPSGIPEMSFALDTGECVRLDERPTDELVATALAAPALSAGGSALVPLAEGPLLILGTPTLRADVETAAPVTLFASLVVVSPDGDTRVVDDQTAPIAIRGAGVVESDLTAVATRLQEGDRLMLRLDGLNEWYAHNSARLPGAAVLTDIRVGLPVVAAEEADERSM